MEKEHLSGWVQKWCEEVQPWAIVICMQACMQSIVIIFEGFFFSVLFFYFCTVLSMSHPFAFWEPCRFCIVHHPFVFIKSLCIVYCCPGSLYCQYSFALSESLSLSLSHTLSPIICLRKRHNCSYRHNKTVMKSIFKQAHVFKQC